MNESLLIEKYNEGLDKGYSYMFVLEDVFSKELTYMYVKRGDSVDYEINKFTEVDTFRLVIALSYELPLDSQLEEYNIFRKKPYQLVLN